MAGSFVYRRGPPVVARNLQGSFGARRGASVQGHEEEDSREQNTTTIVGPDGQRVSDRLQSVTPPSLVYLPPHETGGLPFFCSCYSLCHRLAPERDLHVQSFTSVSAERLSLCLLLNRHGKQQKTLLEAPRSAVVHLDQLLTEQVEKGLLMLAHTCGRTTLKKTSLCSPLESIPGSVTTVDAQREDDIAESQWSLQTRLPFEVPSGKHGGELWAWHFDCSGPPVWTLNSGDLDTFRTLFDPEFCRMPFLVGVLGLDHGPFLAFNASDFMQDKNTPGKNAPDMEEHLAVIYERLRHEVGFVLSQHQSPSAIYSEFLAVCLQYLLLLFFVFIINVREQQDGVSHFKLSYGNLYMAMRVRSGPFIVSSIPPCSLFHVVSDFPFHPPECLALSGSLQ